MSYEVCPKCGGGRQKEKSWRTYENDDGSTVGMCFRASCSYVEKSIDNSVEAHATRVNQVLRSTRASTLDPPYVEPARLHPIRPEALSLWWLDHTSAHEAGWQVYDGQYLYIPCYDGVDHSYQGFCLRAIAPDAKYKAKTHLAVPRVGLVNPSKERFPNAKHVVVVEDAISALYTTGVSGGAVMGLAMLGTRCPADWIQRQLDAGYKVTLAFDADATNLALRTKRDFMSDNRVGVVRLLRDIKDMEYDELEELLFNVCV